MPQVLRLPEANLLHVSRPFHEEYGYDYTTKWT